MNKEHSSDSKVIKSGSKISKKMANFTLLVMHVDKILMQINNDSNLKWPKPLSSSSKRRDQKKYCHFHKYHGLYTDKCRDLKEQIEELIQRGKLQKFVKKYYHYRLKSEDKYNEDHKEDKRDRPKAATREIRMITEGSVM